jgi:hypothetical protein
MKPPIPRYKCSADFLSRIPDFLEQRGLKVQRGSWIRATSSPTGEIGYTISDRLCSIILTGGTLPNGEVGFLVLPNYEGWIWRRAFWLRGRKNALCDAVRSMLVGSGAALWVDYPNI